MSETKTKPKGVHLPESASFRVNKMFRLPCDSDTLSIEELRELRDISARDGDLSLSIKAATGIDKKKGLY
jgi:hypothetical protein